MKTKLTKALPNIITISRIVALILGFIFFMRDNFLISIIFYIYGAVSDAFDGYFARKFDAYSKFGQYLDGISDKLYLLSIIIISIIHKNYLIIIPLVLEVIISIINYVLLILFETWNLLIFSTITVCAILLFGLPFILDQSEKKNLKILVL